MIAVEPRAELGQMFDAAGVVGKPRIGQIALAYDPDEQTAVKRVMDQFRWFTGGWRVNAELPVPAAFEVASKTVREEDVTAQMPCGPDVRRHLDGIRAFEAGGRAAACIACATMTIQRSCLLGQASRRKSVVIFLRRQ
jgi:hypothetical protein